MEKIIQIEPQVEVIESSDTEKPSSKIARKAVKDFKFFYC